MCFAIADCSNALVVNNLQVGHWLNLMHPWGLQTDNTTSGCHPVNAQDPDKGDEVNDTAPVDMYNPARSGSVGCNNPSLDSCPLLPGLDMYWNPMVCLCWAAGKCKVNMIDIICHM